LEKNNQFECPSVTMTAGDWIRYPVIIIIL